MSEEKLSLFIMASAIFAVGFILALIFIYG